MKKQSNHTTLLIFIAALAAFAIALLILNPTIVGGLFKTESSVNKTFPLDLDILGKLKMSYSDSWSINNKGTEGIELTKDNVTILLTTSKTDVKSLDDIVNGKINAIRTTNKITNDKNVVISTLLFRRLEIGSLDETLFPSDGLISYSALLENNIYLNIIVNFPSGTNPSEAEAIINTIRYN